MLSLINNSWRRQGIYEPKPKYSQGWGTLISENVDVCSLGCQFVFIPPEKNAGYRGRRARRRMNKTYIPRLLQNILFEV